MKNRITLERRKQLAKKGRELESEKEDFAQKVKQLEMIIKVKDRTIAAKNEYISKLKTGICERDQKIEKLKRKISHYNELDKLPKTSTFANKELEIQRRQEKMEKLWYGN